MVITSRRNMIRLRSYLILFIMLTVFYAFESERTRIRMNTLSERTVVHAADALSDKVVDIMGVLEDISSTGNGDIPGIIRSAESALEYLSMSGIGENPSENLNAYFHRITDLENESGEQVIAESRELYNYASHVYSWLELLASKNYDAESTKKSFDFPEYEIPDNPEIISTAGSGAQIKSALESLFTEQYTGVGAARYAARLLGTKLILKELKSGTEDYTKTYYCSNAYVEFTEYGGYLVRMLRERFSSESRYSDEECLQSALDFLKLYGYDAFSESSSEYTDGAVIFGFSVPGDSGSIKVGVSRYDRSVFIFCARDMLRYQNDVKSALSASGN